MPSGLQRGLKSGHEVLSRIHGRIPVLSRNASGTAGPCTVHQPALGPPFLGGLVDHKSR